MYIHIECVQEGGCPSPLPKETRVASSTLEGMGMDTSTLKGMMINTCTWSWDISSTIGNDNDCFAFL